MDNVGDKLSAVVRPLIAIIFGITACYAFLVGRLNPDQWLGLATAVIAFYFAAKTAENSSRRAPNRATDVNVNEANEVTVNK